MRTWEPEQTAPAAAAGEAVMLSSGQGCSVQRAGWRGARRRVDRQEEPAVVRRPGGGPREAWARDDVPQGRLPTSRVSLRPGPAPWDGHRRDVTVTSTAPGPSEVGPILILTAQMEKPPARAHMATWATPRLEAWLSDRRPGACSSAPCLTWPHLASPGSFPSGALPPRLDPCGIPRWDFPIWNVPAPLPSSSLLAF